LTKRNIACRAVIEEPMTPFCCVHHSRDSKCFSMGLFPLVDIDPHGSTRVSPKPHLGWCTRFCGAHERDQQSHRHADHATSSAAI